MKSKFGAIHREYSPNPRKFYAFCTSVTDTTTTSGIIASGKESSTVYGMLTLTFVFFSVCDTYLRLLVLDWDVIVRDMVIRQHLKQSKLL